MLHRARRLHPADPIGGVRGQQTHGVELVERHGEARDLDRAERQPRAGHVGVRVREPLEGLAAAFLARAARIAIYVVAVISALGTLGVDTTSLTAALGAAGLAVGLALRDTLSNLAAGLILAFNGAFRQGDTIEVNSVIGTVMEIDLLTTELKTPDAKKVLIPNGSLMQSSLINYSAYPSRRIDFLVGISYDDDIEKAERIIREVIEQQNFCLKDPEPVVGADNLGDFGQNVLVQVWVDNDFVITGKMALLKEIKRAFDREKITIPFPRYEVSTLQP